MHYYIYIYIYVCMYVCMYVYIYIYVCMYVTYITRRNPKGDFSAFSLHAPVGGDWNRLTAPGVCVLGVPGCTRIRE